VEIKSRGNLIDSSSSHMASVGIREMGCEGEMASGNRREYKRDKAPPRRGLVKKD
jgi:hypothetical protein